MGHYANPGSDSVSSSSQSMSTGIGFSRDPCLNDVVAFPCPSLLPPSSSVISRSKAGGGDRVGKGLDRHEQLFERNLVGKVW